MSQEQPRGLARAPSMRAPPQLTDYISSAHTSNDSLAATLKNRYASGKPYSLVAGHTLLSVNHVLNPQAALNIDTITNHYTQVAHSTDDDKPPLDPHVYSTTVSAWTHMVRDATDQTVVLMGESGSGKTYAHELLLQQLLSLSESVGGREAAPKVHSGAKKIATVMEAFGTSKSTANPSASRVSRYTEYQFDASGRLIGLKLLDYLLDRSRVTVLAKDIHGSNGGHKNLSEERNYNIFYSLLAGANAEEIQRFKFDSVHNHHRHHSGSNSTRFAYLGNTQTFDEDVRNMDKLRDDLKSIGVGRRIQHQIYALLAGILHLGNIEFESVEKNEPCEITNVESLKIAAELFGISSKDLAATLTTSTKLFNKELASVFLNEKEASKHRDNLASSIYNLIFEWLVEHINTRFCLDDCDVFIGVVDIVGCHDNAGTTGGSNGLRELLGNFGNDCLHMYLHRHIIRQERRLQEEGVQYDGPKYAPKTYEDLRGAIISVGGLFSQIDHIKKEDAKVSAGIIGKKMEQRLERIAGGTDGSKYYDFNRSFIAEVVDGRPIIPKEYVTVPYDGNFVRCVVRHGLDQEIEYDLTDFVDYNHADFLPADFVGLFRGNGRISASSNALARDIFSDRLVMTEKHARDDNVVTSARTTSVPKRTPSIRRKNSTRTTANSIVSAAGAGDNEATGCYSFNIAFQELIDTIDDTNPWFIFCVKPNERIISDKYDTRKVSQQLRNLDVLPLRKYFEFYDYSKEYDIDEFISKYDPIISPLMIDRSRGPHFICEDLLRESNWNIKDMAIGKNTIFLSETAYLSLEDELRSIESDKAVFGGNLTSDPQLYHAVAGGAAAGGAFGGYMANDPSGMGGLTSRHPYNYQGSNVPSRAMSMDSLAEIDDPYGIQSGRAARGNGERVSISMDPNNPMMMMNTNTDVITAANSEVGDNSSDNDRTINDITFADGVGVVNKSGNGLSKDADYKLKHGSPTLPYGLGRKDDDDELEGEEELVETGSKLTKTRKRWLCCTWSLTWCCFPCCLNHCGGMKRKDIQLAWREKFALCFIIISLCAAYLFFIIGLGRVICPKQDVMSPEEVGSKSKSNSPLSYMDGRVYNYQPIMQSHLDYGIKEYVLNNYKGVDISYLFNKTLYFSDYCPGFTQPAAGWDYLSDRQTLSSSEHMHNITTSTNGQTRDYLSYMNQYAVDRVGYTWKYIKKNAVPSKRLIVIYDNVYDVTTYFNSPFFDSDSALSIFSNYLGRDATKAWESQVKQADSGSAARMLQCMNNMFYIGIIDTRDSGSCKFSNYVLLAATCFIVAIIFAKFVSALRFGSTRIPEEHDKFVICQIPCYTEGEESLTRSIQSLTTMKYDDSRKLLLIVCDGMIVGSGNDRPTPQIVLDILGVDPNYDPEPLSFQSLGEGDRQLNYGKIYSGLYEHMGHGVPYLVVVKIGAPSERSKPGNRGKRDSQLILMRFLSRVHFKEAMSPLELEMYHHMKNIIGVSPSFYEYILMVDADTSVFPDALLQMVSTMVNDSKVMGLCGETLLQNEKKSWITMIQVYEYFISHHLSKAFESLFGTVTCLPGCFCMYRVRTPLQNKPLLISQELLDDYATNRVDTLHMKNLLHLGEDRYLTTLMLKHFPNMKTSFTNYARCMTFAPEQWSILLSQRRRWINSTVHNLLELSMIDGLCGFCCFSMRFIVMLDLFSTFVQPAALAYIAYLIYTCVSDPDNIPIISLILIAAVYALQVFIFLIKQQWAQIGWMFIYIMAMPVFSLYIPLYSFWHFDDFSWGNTRIVIGDKGRKMVYSTDVKPFDPNSIPMQTWEDYEQELYEKIQHAQYEQEQQQMQAGDLGLMGQQQYSSEYRY